MPAVPHGHIAGGIIPAAKRNDPNFFIGNRIRTCIGGDEAEARAILRRTVTNYALMPNYRNYWKEAGYVEEMTAIENAVAEGRSEDLPKYLPDRWLADVALFGSAGKDTRRGRGVARRRGQDAGPGAAFRRRHPETAIRQVFDRILVMAPLRPSGGALHNKAINSIP